MEITKWAITIPELSYHKNRVDTSVAKLNTSHSICVNVIDVPVDTAFVRFGHQKNWGIQLKRQKVLIMLNTNTKQFVVLHPYTV